MQNIKITANEQKVFAKARIMMQLEDDINAFLLQHNHAFIGKIYIDFADKIITFYVINATTRMQWLALSEIIKQNVGKKNNLILQYDLICKVNPSVF